MCNVCCLVVTNRQLRRKFKRKKCEGRLPKPYYKKKACCVKSKCAVAPQAGPKLAMYLKKENRMIRKRIKRCKSCPVLTGIYLVDQAVGQGVPVEVTAFMPTGPSCEYCFPFFGFIGTMKVVSPEGDVTGFIPQPGSIEPTMHAFTGKAIGGVISMNVPTWSVPGGATFTFSTLGGSQPATPLVLDEVMLPQPAALPNLCGGFTEVSNIRVEALTSTTSLLTSSLGAIKLTGLMYPGPQGAYYGYSEERNAYFIFDPNPNPTPPNVATFYVACCDGLAMTPFFYPAP